MAHQYPQRPRHLGSRLHRRQSSGVAGARPGLDPGPTGLRVHVPTGEWTSARPEPRRPPAAPPRREGRRPASPLQPFFLSSLQPIGQCRGGRGGPARAPLGPPREPSGPPGARETPPGLRPRGPRMRATAPKRRGPPRVPRTSPAGQPPRHGTRPTRPPGLRSPAPGAGGADPGWPSPADRLWSAGGRTGEREGRDAAADRLRARLRLSAADAGDLGAERALLARLRPRGARPHPPRSRRCRSGQLPRRLRQLVRPLHRARRARSASPPTP